MPDVVSEATAVSVAVDLVNTWDVINRPPELLGGVDALRRMLRSHGLESAAAAATEEDVVQLRGVRQWLRDAFEAGDEEAAVAILNQLVVEAQAVPRLVRASGEWLFRFGEEESPGPMSLVPQMAVGLLNVVRGGGWDRLGICAAAPCRCVYVDRSRNRSRRYCCQLCSDRAAQAAHRRRVRSSSAEKSS